MISGGARIRVLIATTKGPVEIVRMARENPAVHSVICVDGSLAALPISPAYDAFVREPTGVIERLTGHPVYRTDLSAAIDGGTSWQLGLFLAHALAEAGCLAGAGEEPERTILVTGALDRDLNVRPVDHLAEKLARADETNGSGLFLMPVSDSAPVSSGKWELVQVANAAEALAACGLAEQQVRTTAAVSGSRSGRLGFAAGGIALATLLVGLGFWVAIGKQDRPAIRDAATDAASPPELSLGFRLRNPDSGRCGPVELLPAGADSVTGSVCRAVLHVRGHGAFRVRLAVRGDFLSYVDPVRYTRWQEQVLGAGEEMSVRIDFPYWVRSPMTLEAEVARLDSDAETDLIVKRSVTIAAEVRDGERRSGSDGL